MARRAVVTGGTGGIGFHVAQELHEHGFTVTVVGRDPGHGADAVRRIGGGDRSRTPTTTGPARPPRPGAVGGARALVTVVVLLGVALLASGCAASRAATGGTE